MSGLLGKSALAAATDTSVYTVGAAFQFATVNINIVNTSAVTVTVRLAISTTGSPATSDYLEYDFPLAGSGVLERTGIVMSANEVVVARASAAGVSVRVHGIEKA